MMPDFANIRGSARLANLHACTEAACHASWLFLGYESLGEVLPVSEPLIRSRALRGTGSVKTHKSARLMSEPRIYVYTDDFGEVAYRKVRYDQPKRFVWESLNEAGHWTRGLKGRTLFLYRQPELISSPDPVWLPKGEKDVETLRALGMTATTSGGASDSWLPGFDRYLAGREVIILT